jgi:hypothetical protein
VTGVRCALAGALAAWWLAASFAVGANPPVPPPLPMVQTTINGTLCPKCRKAGPRLDTVDVIRDVVLNNDPKGPRGVMLRFQWKCGKCGEKFRTLETLK